jgi:hypothetical protein
MPLSSTEIAQMNGAFQQQAANNLAYSGMIGQGSGVYGGMRGAGAGGDRVMGGAMSTAGAVGGPLAAGAMGLLGLDPMSIGLKAGMSAFGSGAGVGGSLMAGAAAAMPLMAVGAAASYAGGQMFHGAGQQQELNQQLRTSFNFVNRSGGQGFNRTDMTAIGGAVREMSEQFGPGGEIASFKELSGLAGKMGQMGFAQGVRDVKEFTTRFKDMVKSLKTMATDLGTTLEGAMEFAQAAKSSGVFGMNRASGFTAAARQAAVGGGLALSEVTGAASIGSQISRSIGGLGRQGALAGVKTIGQIGAAQQMGALSEEDIYNVTGQTGAEGRQAYAASAMSSSARFLQSGKGRRMLASIAGKDGTLDENAVQQIMSGNMSISETIRQDSLHVTGAAARVSRANFIRNEGRLRGAALEKMGGFLNVIQMKDWAESKGVDLESAQGHDRAMLFMQRQLGMGRDEADQAVNMALKMPQIEDQQRRSAEQDKYLQSVATARKGQGIEGVGQRFNQAKELLNSKLQKVGQDLFNSGAETIDSFFNRLMGTYVDTYSKDIDDKYRAMRGGGAAAATAGRQAFGIGESSAAVKALTGGRTSSVQGRAGTEDLASAMNRGGDPGSVSAFLFGQSGVSKLREAGYDIKGMNSQQIQAKLQTIQGMQRASTTGIADADLSEVTQGGRADWLSDAYAMGKVKGTGDDRIKSILDVMDATAKTGATDMNNPNAQSAMALQRMMVNKTPEEKAALLANVERTQNITGKGALANNLGVEGGIEGLLGKQLRGGFATAGEKDEAFAAAFGGGAAAGPKRSFMDVAMAGMGGAAGAAGAGAIAAGVASETKAQTRAVGEYLQTKAFRDTASDFFSGNKETVQAALKNLTQSMASGAAGKVTDEEAAVNDAQRKLKEVGEWSLFMNSTPGGMPDKAAQEKYARDHGTTVEALQNQSGAVKGILNAVQGADLGEEARRVHARAAGDRDQLSAHGVMNAAGGLTAQATKELGGIGKADKTGKTAAQRYAEAALGSVTAEESLTGRGDAQDAAGFAALQAAGDTQKEILSGMSVSEKRRLAGAIGGEEGARVGASAANQASLQKKIARAGGDVSAGAAAMLGLSGKEYAKLDLSSLDGAKMLLSKAGLDTPGAEADVRAAAKKGKGGIGEMADVLKGLKEALEVKKDAEKKDADYLSSPEGKAMAALQKNSEEANSYFKRMVNQLGTLNDKAAEAGKDPEKPAETK